MTDAQQQRTAGAGDEVDLVRRKRAAFSTFVWEVGIKSNELRGDHDRELFEAGFDAALTEARAEIERLKDVAPNGEERMITRRLSEWLILNAELDEARAALGKLVEDYAYVLRSYPMRLCSCNDATGDCRRHVLLARSRDVLSGKGAAQQQSQPAAQDRGGEW